MTHDTANRIVGHFSNNGRGGENLTNFINLNPSG